ncbi:MAG: tyrosine--tRNA ligase [Christensenellales bacterium]|jgi:tyrosyl-tRNA synthetase
MNVFDILSQRGFVKQYSHEELKELLVKESVTFYIGFDPTADSLHIGHYLQLMAMAHMQRAGHKPIALIGGGTTMVGDPSGRTDMRKMLSKQDIERNAEKFKSQISRFLDFSEDKAIMVDNADWLLDLNYVNFLREIGAHFSVNRMLSAECFKSRMEKGLSFLEFNYMLMQAYDFLELYRRYGCRLQLGGDDQWSNILAGADLIRRKEAQPAFAMTFTLLTKSDGTKMGKTASGAVWLDAEKTTPYEFYQYWRNVDDKDVKSCLSLMTFLPMDEVERLGALKDAQINEAKRVLAYEVTKQVHGEEQADKAAAAAEALFGSGDGQKEIPTSEMSAAQLLEGDRVIDALHFSGLAPSKSEARRLIQSGAVSVDDRKVTDIDEKITLEQLTSGVMLKKGKKGFRRLILKSDE